jgi:hypothetical protein
VTDEHEPDLELRPLEYVCPREGCWLVHHGPPRPEVCDA